MTQQKGAARIELGQIQLGYNKVSFGEVFQNQNKILADGKQVLPLLVFANHGSTTLQTTCVTKTQGFYVYTKSLLGQLLKKYYKLKNGAFCLTVKTFVFNLGCQVQRHTFVILLLT